MLVKESSLRDIHQRTAELKNWLAAIVAYQQSCLDDFDIDVKKKVQEQLQSRSLDNVGSLDNLVATSEGFGAEAVEGVAATTTPTIDESKFNFAPA